MLKKQTEATAWVEQEDPLVDLRPNFGTLETGLRLMHQSRSPDKATRRPPKPG